MSSNASARTEASPHDPIPTSRRLIAAVVPLVPAWRIDKTFDYEVPPEVADAVEVGSLVRVRFGNRNVRAVVTELGQHSDDRDLEAIGRLVVDPPMAAPPIDELLRWIARRYVVPMGRAFSRVVPPRVRVRVQESKPLATEPDAELLPDYEGGQGLIAAIEATSGGVWTFECLPGQDRSSLLAELVAATGRAKRSALVLVPEVHYGSKILDGLAETFGDIARVDSAQTDGDRAESMIRLALGHGLGGGGRAAVVAPARDLGLMVLDEEHHPSYKEERSPRYDARRVAVERARLSGAVCVLMSSTPSVESGAASLDGRYGWVTPQREARRSARPVVEFVDRDEGRAISHPLHVRIQGHLKEGGRVALLAPAQGYARAIWCAACQRSLRCPRCEAGLSLDRAPGDRKESPHCRRCGSRPSGLETCPHCGATDFRWIGSGSQRLAEQLARSFPRARVVYMDPDDVEASAAAATDADIYVTTWIGTKAAIRPDVTLVGIVDADALIRRPHFRATERAYQALAEMSEWAGPASAGGRLVIQGKEPGHYALQALARGDYRFFLERELESRRELRYPPYSELVRITTRGGDADRILEAASSGGREAGGTVLGPIDVWLKKGGEMARQILIKCPDAGVVADALRPLARTIASGTALTIDVDPR